MSIGGCDYEVWQYVASKGYRRAEKRFEESLGYDALPAEMREAAKRARAVSAAALEYAARLEQRARKDAT